MIRPARFAFMSALFLVSVLILAACDAPAGEEGASAPADNLPAVANAPAPEIAVDGASMEESSPGGEAVTESELPPQSDVPAPPRAVFSDAECAFEAWIGKPVDEAAIKNAAGENRAYRILKPGSMMTMDHRPDRINVEHDEGGTVTRVWCG